MMTSEEIRQHFFDFFKSKGHIIVPSAPIVIKDDPTLLFTNAGMNQFKDYFLGNKKAPQARVADTQKCLRVSGKHNDLEEVGVDTYHHTMFEMLGNWSFGDYFKEEAIAWSWELLTEVYKIDKEKLYVTVFGGDEIEGMPEDDEAINFWKQHVSEERILRFGKKDNFWEMGDTGPCGPCTEIHVDCRTEEERKNAEGKNLVNNDHPQVIEIWNNVFIQFNRLKDRKKIEGLVQIVRQKLNNGEISQEEFYEKELETERDPNNTYLVELPEKHVDTGMGFERLVRVLQNKQSNYDTDVFMPTIEAIEKIVGLKYNSSPIPAKGVFENSINISFRVIADHIRAICFTVGDGQLPSNTGAGYVIRRILRRASRYYFSNLNYKSPLLNQLVPVIAKQFENVFPEIKKQQEFITKVIKEEEEGFLRTLDKGLFKINEIIKSTPDEPETFISGIDAFELYDTFGFPLDLTKLIASENNIKVDEAGFEAEMQQQKNRSRSASVVDTEDWITVNENGSSKFVGYDSFETESKVLKYRKTKAQGKESYQIVLDQTPFYAESGGQVGDKGQLIFDGEQIEVTDTKKENDLIIHFTQKLPAEISSGVIAKINSAKRIPIQVHHSATHLMHAALRSVLGKHVAQKGSLVNDEYLRFDFSHFAKVTDYEIAKVESIVNEKIRENIPVVIKQMPKEEALATGAMALFGEKYGDTVRVVIIDPNYSIELCGGTHVGATGELGIFKINHETAVGAGVRRIEAVSGKAAEDLINQEFGLIRVIRDTLKNPKDIQKGIENLITENSELKKQLEKFEAKNLLSIKNDLLQKIEIVNAVNFIGQIIDVPNADALKKICFSLKNARLPNGQELKDYVIVLGADIDGKPNVAIMLDETIASSKNLEAPKIIKEHIAPLIKGGGGGQKTLATAGGQDASNLKQVLEKVKSLF